MSRFKQHFFVCTNTRPPFAKPSCGPKDSNPIVALLKEEVEKHDLVDSVKITACGCLGPCEEGPIMVVYPDGTWYRGVTPTDVAEIVDRHVLQNEPVKTLLYTWPETNNS